jgi:tRNA-dihydrouridine synthase B
MIRATGVAGVMYARGALADPAIFAKHAAMVRGEPAPPGLPSTGEIIREHVRLLRSREDSQRTLRRMRSIVPRYIRELRGARALRQRLTRCASFEELEQIIAGLEEAMAPSSRGRG